MPPKTEESEREIPFGQAVKEALTRLRTSERKANDFLFVTVRGNLFCPQRVTKTAFRPLAAKLGVAPFTWRSFRRSAETALHTHGIPLKVQQQILGHSSPVMTLLYADPNLSERREAIEQLESLICQVSTEVARAEALTN